MHATVLVEEAHEEPQGSFVRISVKSGKLKSGMECRAEAYQVIITQLSAIDTHENIETPLGRGSKALALCRVNPLGSLSQIVGEVVEFSDIRAMPVKGSMLLRPEIG